MQIQNSKFKIISGVSDKTLKSVYAKLRWDKQVQGDDTRVQRRNMATNRGFTILETLFAIFILMLSITGPMVFAQSGLRASFQARDQITGFFLAQDVIETIKNIRDDNGIDGTNPWLSTLVAPDKCGGTDTPCYIDTTFATPDIKACSGNCPPLKITNGKYGYAGSVGDESRFTRTVYVKPLNTREAAVVVEVEWTSHVATGRHRIVVQENIFSWIPSTN